ncbi:MAG: peptidoglycan DD-metalloendopeptidase family protein [Clostridiales bacterium]
MKRVIAVLVIVLVIVGICVNIFAETDNALDPKKERQKIKEEINTVNKEKSENKNEVEKAEEDSKKLESEKDKKEREIHLLTSEILKADKTLEDINIKVEQAEKDYEEQMENFEKRLLVMYQNSELSYVEVLIRSKDLFEFYQKLDIMTKITKKDKIMLKNLSLAKKEVEYNKEIQISLKKDKEEKALEFKTSLNKIMKSQETVKSEIDKRKTTISLLEKMQEELEKESQKIETSIKAMELPGEYTGGVMLWPVPSSNAITSKFGYRTHPIYGTKRLHTGVDISGNYDASIIAVNNGKVIFSGWKSGYGNTVLISHGGNIVTLYGHCSKLIVNCDQVVKAGDIIAKVGSTGASTGNHLHFEVRDNGSPSDPLKYILP